MIIMNQHFNSNIIRNHLLKYKSLKPCTISYIHDDDHANESDFHNYCFLCKKLYPQYLQLNLSD